MGPHVEEIFHQVADLSYEDRNRYFDEQAVDPETRREVSALLAFESTSGVTLDGEVARVAHHALSQLERQSTFCGPYRLDSVLGFGGMGSVYLAERVDGEVSQRVAIKVLRLGADTERLRGRFLAERQILAALSHPHIARLLDAGHREEGQPYLVMEYIQGNTIDVYAADLSTRQIIKLFLKVCGAISYLHRNLIVHRDLKPGNILVTAGGEPKLLDFGIAKMLDAISDSASTTIPMLTPDYASPEQVLGNQASTATDIYSLGAVLYRLLTGEPPHRFENASLRDIVAAITWEKITPPSKLAPHIKGDLELIILKALRREPQERYLTVDQLSEDLQNYLESRPIRARRGDTLYQFRKLLRRHWRAISALLLVMASLLAGTLIARRQQIIAQRRFQQVRQLASRFIELHDDIAQLPGSTKIRESMVATALDYLDSLSQNVGDDAQLLAQIGQVYSKIGQAQGGPSMANLGHANEALLSFRKAIQFEGHAAALDPVFRVNLAFFHADLAYLALLNGLFPEGQQNLEAATMLLDQLREEKRAQQDLLLLGAQIAGIRADLSEMQGNYDEELTYSQKAAALRYEYLRLKPGNAARLGVYRATTLVASALGDNGRYEEALTILQESTPVIESLVAEQPENPFYLRQEMAVFNYEGDINDNETGKSLNNPPQAIAALKHYVRLAKKLTDDDPNNASARLSLASAYCKLSWPLGKINPQQSLHVASDALRLFNEELARNPHDRVFRDGRARALRHLAYAYSRNCRLIDAITAIKQAIAVQEQLVSEAPEDQHEQRDLSFSNAVLKSFLAAGATETATAARKHRNKST